MGSKRKHRKTRKPEPPDKLDTGTERPAIPPSSSPGPPDKDGHREASTSGRETGLGKLSYQQASSAVSYGAFDQVTNGHQDNTLRHGRRSSSHDKLNGTSIRYVVSNDTSHHIICSCVLSLMCLFVCDDSLILLLVQYSTGRVFIGTVVMNYQRQAMHLLPLARRQWGWQAIRRAL